MCRVQSVGFIVHLDGYHSPRSSEFPRDGATRGVGLKISGGLMIPLGFLQSPYCDCLSYLYFCGRSELQGGSWDPIVDRTSRV